jgi:hypothetical protein
MHGERRFSAAWGGGGGKPLRADTWSSGGLWGAALPSHDAPSPPPSPLPHNFAQLARTLGAAQPWAPVHALQSSP